MPGNTFEPIDWDSYREAVDDKTLNNVAFRRGYSLTFVEQLHAAGFLGLCSEGQYEGWRAFPVHDAAGSVIAAHVVHRKEKVFRYTPSGCPVHPLVIGDLATATTVHAFESQWDMFAVMDRREVDPGEVPFGTAYLATRGASNVGKLEGRLFADAMVIAWTQNDEKGNRWLGDLEALCLRSGLRFTHLAPPREYKDFNDLFRADPDGTMYHQASLEARVLEAVQAACERLGPGSPDLADTSEEEPEVPLPPFPVHCLPETARDIIGAGAEVLQVPPVLLAVCVLGALSAALGAGIAVQSVRGRKSYANLYLLAAAASGAGKSDAARLIYEAIYSLESELIRTHDQDVRPRASARKATLLARIKKLEKAAQNAPGEGEEFDLSPAELELETLQTELKEIEQKLVPPRLIVGDVTTEALGVLLAKHIVLASFSPDARDEISNLLGRYRDKGKTDEGLYIKMWSGDFHQVDRIGRDPLRLENARLSLLWLVQPDKLHEVVSAESLWAGGLLPRMLLVQTGAQMQHIDPDRVVEIPPEVKESWSGLLRTILEGYRRAAAEREPVQSSPEAARILAGVHNQGVDQIRDGPMRDMESFVARWAEQAWRIALILHVAKHPADAESHVLSAETATAAAEIGQWFFLQQGHLLARGREEKRRKKFEHLSQILELMGGEETVRKLRDRHGLDKQELDALVAAFPTRLAMVQQPSGSRGGRPSLRVKLI